MDGELAHQAAAPFGRAIEAEGAVAAGSTAELSASDLAGAIRAELSARLGIEPSALRDDAVFSAYGLDSLKAAGFVAALSELTGRRLSATLPWECPTIERLVARLLGGDTADAATSPDQGTGQLRPAHTDEPVAVVGMACRFPGADDLGEFWRLLGEGADLVGPAPSGRPDPDSGPRNAGYLRGPVDRFDPLFFGIAPREASEMDPQQRLFLEVAWEALDAAGLGDGRLAGSRTGVFAGAIWHDYADLCALEAGPASAHTATGHSLNMIANRLSYVLGLRGPSLVIDSACSSSLLAVHLACQSLARGESTLAIAGGVNLLLDPRTTEALEGFGGLAPDGRCKAFDARADGFGRGEGAGVVVLKPLSRALADGDRIWCVIRGSAANNDGLSNGLTAPNPLAQQEVLRQAYRLAGVDAHEIAYVEAHGTGTALGDPIEAAALGAVLTAGRAPETPDLVLSSVKANIGHLEGAAGIAGLIKAALSVHHREIPPNPHFATPNAAIDFEALRIRVPSEFEPWPEGARPLAGVSAFGWGGTNVHLVLEGHGEPTVRALPTADPIDAAESATAPDAPAIAFVCSPYGHQWAEMGVELMRAEPVFRAAVEECDRVFAPLAGWSLAEELAAGRGDPQRVDVVQPLLFAVQIGLARLLEHSGVRPAAVIGHSLGEIPAAVIAGILDPAQASALVYHYTRHQQLIARPEHSMAVVEHSVDELAALLGPVDDAAVAIAARNGPRSTVLSGDRLRLESIVGAVKEAGAAASMIRIDVAAHGPAIDAVIDELVRDIGELHPRPGNIPMVSSVTGEPLDWRDVDAAYFARNLRTMVRLDDAVRRVLADGASVLLEISAHPVLLHALTQIADEGDHEGSAAVLGSMRRGDDVRAGLADMFGLLHERGWQPAAREEGEIETAQLLMLSAQSPEALRELAGNTARALLDVTSRSTASQSTTTTVADVCRAAARRTGFPYRLAAVGRDLTGLAADLELLAEGVDAAAAWTGESPAVGRPRVAFVFPGQGSQWPGMARRLLAEEPVFAAVLRECDAKAAPLLGWSMLEHLRAGTADGPLGGQRVDFVQPMLFAFQVALAALWRSWGIEPDIVIGHSMGEAAAAVTAGALPLEDGLRIICLRTSLMREAAGRGAMLAAELTIDEARALTEDARGLVSVAVNNSPRSTVLSGDVEALKAIKGRLDDDSVFCRWVKVDVASHSPHMDDFRDRLLAQLDGLRPTAGTVPIRSTVLSATIDGSGMDPVYWADNLREPVMFSDGVQALLDADVSVFIEISPHPILSAAVEQVAAHVGRRVTALPSLRRDEDARAVLLQSLGAAYLAGHDASESAALRPGLARLVDLPPYPWQREQFPIPGLSGTRLSGAIPAARRADGAGLLLGARLDSAIEPGLHYWQTRLSADAPAVADHRLHDVPVVPGSAYLDLALAAADEIAPGAEYGVADLIFASALAPSAEQPRLVQSVLSESGDGDASFRIFDLGGPDPVLLAAAVLRQATQHADAGMPREGEPTVTLTEDDFYRLLADNNVDCGPTHRRVTGFEAFEDGALAQVKLTPQDLATPTTRLPRAAFDAAFQTAVVAVLSKSGPVGPGMVMVEAAESITFSGEPTDTLSVHARLETVEDGVTRADLRMADSAGGGVMTVVGLRIRRLETMPEGFLDSAANRTAARPAHNAPQAAGPANAAETIAGLKTAADPIAALETLVRANVARVVRTAPERVGADQPLRMLGIDSAMSLELRNRLEREFGVKLPASLIWNHPTIRELVPFLAETIGLAGAEPEQDTAPPPSGPTALDDEAALLFDADDEEALMRELERLEAWMEDL